MKNKLRAQALIGFTFLVVLGIGPGICINHLLFLAGAQKEFSLLVELVVTMLVYYRFEPIRVIKNLSSYTNPNEKEEQLLRILQFHWDRYFWFCVDSPFVAALIGLGAAMFVVLFG